MAQPYRIQDSRSGKRIQPQNMQDNNTGMARNHFNRRDDRISRTTSSKNLGRSEVISFSVEEAGETSMNGNEPAPTVEEVIELSDMKSEFNPKIPNNSSSQNDTQNAIQPKYQAEIRRRIHLHDQIRPQTEEEREYLPSPREGFTDLDKDTIVTCSKCNHGLENGT
ncbi:9852_t:CDS:2, partial [Ambispora leptoticha]